jgi:sorbitol-specific phosphotransferase system component IIC
MTDMSQRTRARLTIPYPLVLIAAAVGVILFGFSHTIGRVLLHPPVPAPQILWVHVALASTWLGVLLVSAGRLDLHRRLGPVGAVIGAVMSVVAFFTAVELRKLDTVGDPVANIAYLAIPLAAWVTFTVPFALALAWRRDPSRHRPLMIMAACAVMGPALGRIPEVRHAGLFWAGLIPDLMLLSAMAHDRWRRGCWNPTYAVGVPLMALTQGAFVFLQIAQPPAWVAAARWLMMVF